MDASAPEHNSRLEAAEAALVRQDPAGALALLADHRSAHPADPAGYAKACDILRKQKRLEEAAALCEAGLARARGAGSAALTVQRARIAQAAGDLAGALEHWRRARTSRPQQPGPYIGEAGCLLEMRDMDAAEYLATYTAAKFPDHLAVCRQAAQVAVARQDWPEALARWDRVLAREPQDALAIKGRAQAAARLPGNARPLQAEAAADEDHEIAEIARVDDPASRDLVLRFESLGQNCELGLVQRRFGAEPLGLLRWANTKPAALAKYLGSKFAELGQPEKMTLSRTSSGENVLIDHALGQVFHTFQRDDVTDPDTYLKKHAARLRFLRDKLVGELEAGEKIFVFKPSQKIAEGLVRRVWRAVQEYGAIDLLWVEQADSQNPAGSVRRPEDGLLRGYLSVLNPVRPKDWQIPFEEWLLLCRKAAEIVDRRRATG